MPWWGVLLIALGSLVFGSVVAVVWVASVFAKGMSW